VGITLEGVGQLERGRRRPSWDTAVALAQALGVSVAAFESPGDESTSTPEPRRPGRPRKADAVEDAEREGKAKGTRRKKA
jgi:transcriptional regulator with XRE-family HTH domain